MKKRQRRPIATSESVSEQMRRQKTSATMPELLVRRALYQLGLRYRVNHKLPILPRRSIDISFPKYQIAIFIDGCFWHGCSEHRNIPSSNYEWWSAKLAENKKRDVDTDLRLQVAGWKVLRFWEHEATEMIVKKIMRVIKQRGKNG